jgi:hypothetical protein
MDVYKYFVYEVCFAMAVSLLCADDDVFTMSDCETDSVSD